MLLVCCGAVCGIVQMQLRVASSQSRFKLGTYLPGNPLPPFTHTYSFVCVLCVFLVSEQLNKSYSVMVISKPLDCSSELRFSGTQSYVNGHSDPVFSVVRRVPYTCL